MKLIKLLFTQEKIKANSKVIKDEFWPKILKKSGFSGEMF